MDDKKVIDIRTENKYQKEQSEQEKKFFSSFQTNPILKKMLFANVNTKKGKFQLKDLFR